jgi:hypothetical protein
MRMKTMTMTMSMTIKTMRGGVMGRKTEALWEDTAGGLGGVLLFLCATS